MLSSLLDVLEDKERMAITTNYSNLSLFVRVVVI